MIDAKGRSLHCEGILSTFGHDELKDDRKRLLTFVRQQTSHKTRFPRMRK